MSLVTLVAFLLLFPGASAQEPEQKPSTEPAAPAAEAKADLPATVYVYRHKPWGGGSAVDPSVYCDEQELARMDDGRYFVIKLEPGRHSFRSTDKRFGGTLIVKPGEAYYLNVQITPHFPVARGVLHAVLPERATYDLKKLRYLGADKIRSTRVLPEDPGAPQ